MMIAKACVLLVEDDRSVREMLSILLCADGYTVWRATGAFAAYALICREVPDILISNLDLRGMPGYELLGIARRHSSSIQIIAMGSSPMVHGVPPGVIADAYYERGTAPGPLLEILGVMARGLPGCANRPQSPVRRPAA